MLINTNSCHESETHNTRPGNWMLALCIAKLLNGLSPWGRSVVGLHLLSVFRILLCENIVLFKRQTKNLVLLVALCHLYLLWKPNKTWTVRQTVGISALSHMLTTDRQWGNWLHCLLDSNFTNNTVIKLTMSYYLSITTVITIFSKMRNKTVWRTALILYNTSLLIYFLLKLDSLRFCSVLF